ncbi:flagellar basal body rod protein FlgB [Brevibacillus humidisoli]|uniref:flagellar basal body rod protein FlgB n=1 Tax=Brevibacillus humidisoli TaxID=2895522 RepID=UPI001E39BC88|nr:flagellar basal body rod protein FlgB [Brevibacillus humidisoli]UFJ42121.1 flagellar basal body rod protein FlgB [Brevibacillus humidisoli]
MIQTDHLRLLERSLDVSTLRQRVIANNIANVDTPHFKSKRVAFEEMLRQEMGQTTSQLRAYRTDQRHLSFGPIGSIPEPRITSNPNAMVQHNENDVDLEYEMNRMAENQIWYNGLVQLTGGYFTKLSSVINGGGK